MIDRVDRSRALSAPVALGFAVAIVLGGCASSGGAGGSSSAAATGAASSGTGAPADASTKAAVTTAYETFFDSRTTVARSQAVLQHGASFAKALADEAKSSYADKSSASVSSVTLTAADVADVKFTIKNNGSALLTDTPGKAVRENGAWKVAAATFCGLLELEGNAPDACKDPKITALPN